MSARDGRFGRVRVFLHFLTKEEEHRLDALLVEDVINLRVAGVMRTVIKGHDAIIRAVGILEAVGALRQAEAWRDVGVKGTGNAAARCAGRGSGSRRVDCRGLNSCGAAYDCARHHCPIGADIARR